MVKAFVTASQIWGLCLQQARERGLSLDPLTLSAKERQTLRLSVKIGFAGLLGDGPSDGH